MTTLSLKATNEGTYIITCAFTDQDGVAAIPNILVWSLKDEDGNIINSRSSVSIVTPSTSNAIVLSGDDLKNSDTEVRVFEIVGTYNSSTYGNDLPIIGQGKFVNSEWVDTV